MAYEKREGAEQYTVLAGDSLATIAAARGLRVSEITLFNWGTSDHAAVNRALFERVGCLWTALVAGNAGNTTFDGQEAARGGTGVVLIPTPWKADGLATTKRHTFKAKRPLPCVAVTISTLDRWFIPGPTAKAGEVCSLEYHLEGIEERADKVAIEVRGSNYASAAVAADGAITWTPVDVPVWTREQTPDQTKPGGSYAVSDWTGQSTAADGVLKPRAGKERFINVAFSPYTVLARYFKDAADKDARLDLEPFWPRWDLTVTPPALIAESLKIEWRVRGCTKLKAGQIVVVDRTGAVVFRKALVAADLTQAAATETHSFQWDAKLRDGKEITPEGMPYRVEVEAHTDMDEGNGVALAAMHTEVRLYVHPKTHRPDLDPYVAVTDNTSLQVRCSDDLLTTKPVARGDGTVWCQLQLAKGGFHPGPVDGNAGRADYKIALAEFKRSVPKRRADPTQDYARFVIDASEGDDVKDALEDLTAASDWQRPWFGDPTHQRRDFEVASDDFQTRLREAARDVIVWVDDRHSYADAHWLPGQGQGATTRAKVLADPASMNDHMGHYQIGDLLVDKKDVAIPRPWIPLAVDLPLLSQTVDRLDAEVAAFSEETLARMRASVGPLRVDWTFDEIDEAPPIDGAIDPASYDPTVSRSKAYVQTILKDGQTAYARKDIKRTATYANCPEASGGIRPAALGSYVEAVFARGADSLAPWRTTTTDASRESIATVVHDDLGQAEADVVSSRVGQAGVYLRPSRIAGDGYQVRAQVRFDKVAGNELPNLGTLERRYPLLPQVQTAKMRVWRKASIRSYVCWSDQNSWGACNAGMKKIYDAAWLHIVDERGDAAVTSVIADHLVDDANFKALVRESLNPAAPAGSPDDRRSKDPMIALSSKHLWPWAGAPQFGIFEGSAPGATKSVAMAALLDDVANPFFYNLSNLFGLAIVTALEKKKGKLRGHVVLEFLSSGALYLQQYKCDTCGLEFYYIEHSEDGGTMQGAACTAPLCAGHLLETDAKFTGYYTCANGHKFDWSEGSLAGGDYIGFGCPTDGVALSADQAQREGYTCTTGNWSGSLVESGAGGDHSGERCHEPGCLGKLVHDGQWQERYLCDACNLTLLLDEPTSAGGSYAGQEHGACGQAVKGHLQRVVPNPDIVAPPHVLTLGNKVTLSHTEASDYRTKGLPLPSLGNPLGVALVSDGRAALWGHELGHTRFLEHAAGAGGADNAQHDHQDNDSFNWAGINETDGHSMKWDRACLMTYVTHQTSYSAARDKQCMCGKCIFKTRGWKIAAMVDPPKAVKD